MPTTKYKIWSIGSPVGDGVTQSINIGIAGIAKKATITEPYIVANEFICNRLAQVLLLPCPPGALIESNGDVYFFSLNFNVSGQALPPIYPDDVTSAQSVLCWGIVLFDILIMNPDRHRRNISYDTDLNKIQIYDHSHAFIGTAQNAMTGLAQKNTSFRINGHCLVNSLSSYDGKDEWVDRIKSIPDFYINEVMQLASDVGLQRSDSTVCSDVIKRRRDEIDILLNSNIGSFSKLMVL